MMQTETGGLIATDGRPFFCLLASNDASLGSLTKSGIVGKMGFLAEEQQVFVGT